MNNALCLTSSGISVTGDLDHGRRSPVQWDAASGGKTSRLRSDSSSCKSAQKPANGCCIPSRGAAGFPGQQRHAANPRQMCAKCREEPRREGCLGPPGFLPQLMPHPGVPAGGAGGAGAGTGSRAPNPPTSPARSWEQRLCSSEVSPLPGKDHKVWRGCSPWKVRL